MDSNQNPFFIDKFSLDSLRQISPLYTCYFGVIALVSNRSLQIFSNVCMKLKTHSHVLKDGMEVLKFLHVHNSTFISSCMNLINKCLKGGLKMSLNDACTLIHLVE